jgi:triosephosphate isomerase (TIM)
MHKTPLVIGNWKMNPVSLAASKALVADVRKRLRSKTLPVEVMVAPPFPFIAEVGRLSPSGRVGVVAQTMHPEPVGAFTGEVSALMLKSLGVLGVIVGHSERRAMGMTDTSVNHVLLAALKAQLTPILCIGETTRDTHGDFYDVVESQLKAALKEVPKAKLKEIVIAYEPIWAIGTGNNATPDDVLEMKLFIQKTLINLYDRSVVPKVRILYGGSVNTKNVEALMVTAHPDGFLVGGASLKPDDFYTIINTTAQYAHTTS